ncbi:MAG: cation transporter [Bacteroidaceae bacterium]|nr:cation transporter [Bacteroidaceae bacterium]
MTEAKERERGIFRVTIVGSVCNGLLVAFKAVAGIVGHSPAMVADAVHSLSDFITDIFVLLFVRLSSRPQDGDHEYGHGKYEPLSSLFVGLSLLAVGAMLMMDAGERIWSYAHGATLESPGAIALVAAVVSVAVKEALYWYTIIYARRYNSQAMIANAWHHRSDALSSVATMVGIGGAILLGERWTVLDPVAAVLVSALIIKVALMVVNSSMGELLDHALPDDEKALITKVLDEFEEVSDPHNMRTRHIGPRHSVDIHIRMDGEMTVNQSHAVTRRIERRLREELGADTLVNIHVEPTAPR